MDNRKSLLATIQYILRPLYVENSGIARPVTILTDPIRSDIVSVFLEHCKGEDDAARKAKAREWIGEEGKGLRDFLKEKYSHDSEYFVAMEAIQEAVGDVLLPGNNQTKPSLRFLLLRENSVNEYSTDVNLYQLVLQVFEQRIKELNPMLGEDLERKRNERFSGKTLRNCKAGLQAKVTTFTNTYFSVQAQTRAAENQEEEAVPMVDVSKKYK